MQTVSSPLGSFFYVFACRHSCMNGSGRMLFALCIAVITFDVQEDEAGKALNCYSALWASHRKHTVINSSSPLESFYLKTKSRLDLLCYGIWSCTFETQTRAYFWPVTTLHIWIMQWFHSLFAFPEGMDYVAMPASRFWFSLRQLKLTEQLLCNPSMICKGYNSVK